MPTARPEATLRHSAVDAARGLAVLGVGWCNAPAMAGLPGGPGDVPDLTTTAGRWAWVVGQVLLQGRMVALMSLLFGASMVWIGGDGRDRRRSGRLDRRLGWLAVIGMLHGVLLWWGDILLPYAVVGLVLRPCRGWSARSLFVLGMATFVLGVAVLRVDAALALWHHGMGKEGQPAPVWHLPGNALIWLAALPKSLVAVLMTSGPMMAIGMAMARGGWLDDVWLRRHAGWLLGLGLVAVLVSLPLALLRAGVWAAGGADVTRFWMIAVGLASAPAGALGWLGVAAIIGRQELLVAVGRVALSTYLTQSLFLHVGLGLISGALIYENAMSFAGMVLGFQMFLAWIWHGSGRQGPAEAVWRNLYRGERNPT